MMTTFQELLVQIDQVEEARTSYGSTSTIRSFKDLRVWKTAVDLASSIYKFTDTFPKQEQFGITSQLRRSIVSVSSNIAEGWGRDSEKEFARFIDISLGSLCETQSLIAVCVRIGLLEESETSALEDSIDHLSRMLHRFRNKLRQT